MRKRDLVVIGLATLCVLASSAGLAAGCGSLPLEGDALDGGGLPPGRFHPLDYALPERHGPDTNLGAMDCRACHGGDLTGIGHSTVSCDSCHQGGWRTSCTYCHGGVEDQSGAPPRDLDGKRDRSAIKFPAHGAHLLGSATFKKIDCDQCHVKATDVLTPDHVFDTTPAAAEVVFTRGLSPLGNFGSSGCANLYCHGDGRSNGSVLTKAEPLTCASCHPSQSDVLSWRRFTVGEHRKHLAKGVTCGDCHGGVVGAGGEDIVEGARHVNGTVELDFGVNEVTLTEGRCTGTCHGETHLAEPWIDAQ